jgi:uncharacterized phage-like protein YoqJ
MTDAIKLYTVQEIAEITKIPRDTLQNWWKRPNQKYQMPAPYAIAGPIGIKLWTEEQVAEIKRDAVAYRNLKIANMNSTRAVKNRQRNERYKAAAKKRADERKALEKAKALEEAKLRAAQRAIEEANLADDFIAEFEREREEKAMQILLGNK